MSEPKLISPMLDNFVMGDPISNRNGVQCCPAMHSDTDEKYLVKIYGDNVWWVSWRGYNQWRKENKETNIDPRRFNRLMDMIAKTCPYMMSYSSNRQRLDGLSTLVHAGKLLEKKPIQEPDYDNIPDMEF